MGLVEADEHVSENYQKSNWAKLNSIMHADIDSDVEHSACEVNSLTILDSFTNLIYFPES